MLSHCQEWPHAFLIDGQPGARCERPSVSQSLYESFNQYRRNCCYFEQLSWATHRGKYTTVMPGLGS